MISRVFFVRSLENFFNFVNISWMKQIIFSTVERALKLMGGLISANFIPTFRKVITTFTVEIEFMFFLTNTEFPVTWKKVLWWWRLTCKLFKEFFLQFWIAFRTSIFVVLYFPSLSSDGLFFQNFFRRDDVSYMFFKCLVKPSLTFEQFFSGHKMQIYSSYR